MFGNLLGASSGGPPVVEMNFRRRPASEIALVALLAILVCVTALLFFAWLTSANPGGRANGGFSADADCVSFGRGGARCVSRSAGDGGSNVAAYARGDCISLGRGGLLCNRVVK